MLVKETSGGRGVVKNVERMVKKSMIKWVQHP
jgi:hypothetical protein